MMEDSTADDNVNKTNIDRQRENKDNTEDTREHEQNRKVRFKDDFENQHEKVKDKPLDNDNTFEHVNNKYNEYETTYLFEQLPSSDMHESLPLSKPEKEQAFMDILK